ncbi:MAG: diguanylate cyclase, partial [Planctomycetes bacterium]|nr:diguanylate cyclase [Planctomycetota bacterium]
MPNSGEHSDGAENPCSCFIQATNAGCGRLPVVPVLTPLPITTREESGNSRAHQICRHRVLQKRPRVQLDTQTTWIPGQEPANSAQQLRSDCTRTSSQIMSHTTSKIAHVLVVDDDPLNRAMLCHLLRKNGYSTEEANGGEEALQKIASATFDLLLLDVMMPGINGFDVLREVRQNHLEVELPVIMVTASDESERVVQVFEQGANDHVTKPFDAAIALARIGIQIRLRKAQLALKESEERYALAASGSNDGIWDWKLSTNEVYYSPRWRQMLGLDPAGNSNSPDEWIERIHPDDSERAKMELCDHCHGQTPHFETELRMQHQDGTYRWMLCRGLAVRDASGKALRIAGSLSDITEGKVADALTGLPNRLLFLERLRRAIDKVEHTDEQFAVLYFDIDNFKLINDSYGHAAGDELLVSVARLLEANVRHTDTIIARLGGDEFTLLIESIHGREDAERLAERLLT